MADQGDSLLREVDQDVRDERMAALWNRYRRTVIVATVVIIFGTLANTQIKNYREVRAGKAMQTFSAAQSLFTANQFNEAALAFANIATTHQGSEIADMAHLWQGRSLAAANKNTDAIAVLKDLAEHPQSKNHLWRDAACLRLVGLDSKQSACLGASDASALAAQRTLTRAALLWNEKKSDEAETLLETLVNNTQTPILVRENAKRYLSVIAPSKSTAKKGM